jgi:hypothetical protein
MIPYVKIFKLLIILYFIIIIILSLLHNFYFEKSVLSINNNSFSINNEYKNFNLYTSLEIDNYQSHLNESHSENDNYLINENESLEIEQISIQNNNNYQNYLYNFIFETLANNISNIYDNCYYFIDWIIGIWDFSRIFDNDINVFEQLSSPGGPVEAEAEEVVMHARTTSSSSSSSSSSLNLDIIPYQKIKFSNLFNITLDNYSRFNEEEEELNINFNTNSISITVRINQNNNANLKNVTYVFQQDEKIKKNIKKLDNEILMLNMNYSSNFNDNQMINKTNALSCHVNNDYEKTLTYVENYQKKEPPQGHLMYKNSNMTNNEILNFLVQNQYMLKKKSIIMFLDDQYLKETNIDLINNQRITDPSIKELIIQDKELQTEMVKNLITGLDHKIVEILLETRR